jgi:hypothetical protein
VRLRVLVLALLSLLFTTLTSVAVNAATEDPFPGPLKVIKEYGWLSVAIGVVCAGLVTVWQLRATSASVELTAGEQERLRSRLLEETWRIWVLGVLERSLGEMLRLELSWQAQRARVTHPVHLLLYGQEEALRGKSPGEVFAELGERLLILGAPGAGKTTMLLEIAKELVSKARATRDSPVPVVLTLSSWPAGRQTRLEDWLILELRRFYDLPKRHARYVVEHGMAAILLDGLDEVPADRVRACAAALNTFRKRQGSVSLAVTCRDADYAEHVEPVLNLTGAVLIRPLTLEEIDEWLASMGPELADLRRAMRVDQYVRDLLTSPLTLTIAAIVYRGEKVETFAGLDALFPAYTQRMLERPRATLSRAKTYPEEETRRWLRLLAKEAVAAEQITINSDAAAALRAARIDHHQARWRSGLSEKLLLLGGTPMALLAGGTALLFGSWWMAVVVTALTVVTAWIRAAEPEASTTGRTHLTRGEKNRRDAKVIFVLPAFCAINTPAAAVALKQFDGMAAFAVGLGLGAVTFLVIAMVISACDHLATTAVLALPDLAKGTAKRIAVPVSLLVAGLAAGIAGSAVAQIVRWAYSSSFVTESSAWQLVLALGTPMILGPVCGAMILTAQYLVSARCTDRIVYRNAANAGLVPKNLTHFLDWAEDRMLLRKSGDDYAFVHLLYRDWWAAQPEPPAWPRNVT